MGLILKPKLKEFEIQIIIWAVCDNSIPLLLVLYTIEFMPLLMVLTIKKLDELKVVVVLLEFVHGKV